MSPEATPTPSVQVDFTLQIGKGQMRVSAEVPRERVNLVQLLPALKQVSSNIVNAVCGGVHAEGFEISCRAGCGACCRQLVPLTLFEAEELGEWIRTLPAEQQAILEGRFNAALAKLKNAGVLDRLDFSKMPDQGSREELQIGLDYFHVGVPCPFLQDESCSIHPIRPLVCREYLVTSPAVFCANPTEETVKPVPMPVKLSRALARLGENITAEKRGWIPLTFLFAWMRAAPKVGQAYEGTGPDLLRLVMERIALNTDTPEAAQG